MDTTVKIIEVPVQSGDDNINEIKNKQITERDKSQIDKAQKSYENKKSGNDDENKKKDDNKTITSAVDKVGKYILGTVVSTTIQNIQVSSSFGGDSEKQSKINNAINAGKDITSTGIRLATSFAVNPILGAVDLATEVASRALNYSQETRKLVMEIRENNIEATHSLERIGYRYGRG